jgi:hypothetical protein
MEEIMSEKLSVRTKEAAEILGVSEIWLKKDRMKADPAGPPTVKKGRMVLYPLAGLRNWILEAAQ